MNNPSKEIYTEIRINATAETVWRILTDFPNHSKWNPFITSISGTLQVGSTLNIHVQPAGGGGMKFTPVVLVAEPNREFRWLGKLLVSGLFDGEHIFEINDHGDGSVTFVQREQFKGLLVPLFKNMLDKGTKQGFELMNQALKEEAEKN